MSLPNSRRVLLPEQIRIGDMNQTSERFRAAGAEYLVDFVVNLEEDGTSLPFLALENVVLLLRSTSNRGHHLANLVDVIATVTILVQTPSLINPQSPFVVINNVQIDIAVVLNQIIFYSSPDAVKSAAREIASVIILPVIDDGIFTQFF